MASTYSTNLGIELIGTGDQSGTWGTTTNTNLGTLLEQAIAGYSTQVVTDSPSATVLTITNGSSSTGRNAVISLTGAITAARTVEIPAKTKMYVFSNDTTGGYAVTVKVNGQTGFSIANGTKSVAYCNGTDAVEVVNNSPSGTVTLTGTQTLTNKRVTPRVSTTTSSATPTINTDSVDMYGLTAQAVNITSFTTNLTGTPTDGQKLLIYIVGTAARTIAWGASFEASTVPLPTTTVTTNRLDVGFIWNAATSKWRCVATA